MSIESIIAENNKLAAEKQAALLAAKREADEKALADAQATAEAEVAAAKKSADDAAAAEAAKTKDSSDVEKLAAEAASKAALDLDVDNDDDVRPNEQGIVSLPVKSFNRRIQRATKSELKKLFGTDDRDAIAKMKENYETVLAKQDEERRAKLDEVTRANEDRDLALARAKAAEEREAAIAESVDAEREERICNRIATQYLDEDSLELAHFKFAKHLKRKSEEELESYSEEQIAAWYKNFADKHPKHAKKAASDDDKLAADKLAAEKEAAAKKAVPLSVGANDSKKPSTKTADPNAKTASPGKSNSMTQKEWSAYKRQHGISY